MTVVPYKDQTAGKKEQVARMFDNISERYDFLNHFLSLGIDVLWRKKAIRLLRPGQPKLLLDIATGTGDFALEALSLKPEKIIGVDISMGMLEVGRRKMVRRRVAHLIEMRLGDSENLEFGDHSFDAITVAFGVRNFAHLEQGLSEMKRVLRPGGQVCIIEFSQPSAFPFRQVYRFYFQYILPKLGRAISSDKAAYNYLPESVQAFPFGKDFLAILERVGFTETRCIPLTFGISSIYLGKKA